MEYRVPSKIGLSKLLTWTENGPYSNIVGCEHLFQHFTSPMEEALGLSWPKKIKEDTIVLKLR
jgi:hypothetical protein